MSEINEFSRRQQEATLGHTFTDHNLWAQLEELDVDKGWFEGAQAQELFESLSKYREVYGSTQTPTVEEFEQYLINLDGFSAASKKVFLHVCLKAAEQNRIENIRMKLVDWAKSRLVAQQGLEISRLFNKGDHKAAFDAWRTGALELDRIEFSAGAMPDKMRSSPERMSAEMDKRLKDGENIIQYGVKFLDDILCGIIPHDLIMIGARTGAGKTELAKIIAAHNAKNKKRVAFFALEAEEAEIERRIKFSILLSLWEKENEGIVAKNTFGYAEWRLGKYKDSLDKNGPVAEAQYALDYPTLKTYYRVRGDFGIADLDREILRISKDTDLIVIDHLHYFDMEGNDENAEMKRLVKRLRGLAIGLGIPILCIAHLKKLAGNSLCPTINDFHGSSDITKIATTCIMLSSCDGFATAEDGAGGTPTFVRVVKFRLDGVRVKFVGVCLYDKTSGGYLDKYAMGHLNLAESKWTPITSGFPYWATTKNVLTDISEVTE